MPALAAVACAERCLARPTGRRGALGDRGTCLPQTRAPCRNVRVPPGVPRRVGPRAEPYGAVPPAVLPERWGPRPRTPLVNRDSSNRAGVHVATCCLEAGSVRGKQDTGRRTPADDSPPVAAGGEVSTPLAPPGVHLPCARRVWARVWRRPAEWPAGGTCRRRGAAAHPPLPLEARYNPPRAAGYVTCREDPSRGACARGSPGWTGSVPPQESPGVAGGANLGADC